MTENEFIILANSSYNEPVTIYFYYQWDLLNWVSKKSILIEQGKESLYQEGSPFKYQVKAKTTNNVQLMKENIFIQIDENGDVSVEPLSDDKYKELNRTVVQYVKFTNKNKTDNDKDIDFFKVIGIERKTTKNEEEEKAFQKELKEKYHEKLRQYHPDHNPDPTGANERITKEIIQAYDILSDKYKRNRYINIMDSKNWKRYLKVVYWPEPISEEEEKTRWGRLGKRLAFTFISAGLFAGGIASLSVLTSGALPIIGFTLLGGGISGGIRSLKEKCGLKDFALATGLGMAVGAVTGGVNVAATVTLMGPTAGALTVGQQIGVGAMTGTVNGTLSSFTSDIEKIAIEGKEISTKQIMQHAVFGALLGTGVGTIGGAVAGKINAAAIQYLDEAAEVAGISVARKVGWVVLEKGTKKITEKAVERVGQSSYKFIEERLDEKVENKGIEEHTIGLLIPQ